MPGVQPHTLPTHFPCWVKAIYSWGGETKRDLGFVEGDLIECLNAGDGAWWMGRLKRDRRQVGLFPSNFVELVADNRPVTPIASPVKQQHYQQQYDYSNSRPSSQASYTSNVDHYARGASPNPYQQQRGLSPNPYQQNRSISPNPGSYNNNRALSPSPNPYQQNRAVSPSPVSYQQMRALSPSPNPYQQDRSVSPNPYHQNRAASPNPYAQNRSVSPNPYAQSRALSPNPYHQNGVMSPNGYNQYRATSPRPPSSQQHRAVSPSPYHQLSYQQGRPTTPNTQMHQQRPLTPNGPISRSGTPNPYQTSMSQGPPPSSQYHMSQGAKSPNAFRAVSPSPMRPVTPSGYNEETTPPPPPPAHSTQYYSRNASPAPSFQHMNGARSPIPSRGPTPQPSPMMAHTPSPLRSAMDDVMSSLEEMSVADSGRKSPLVFSDYDHRSPVTSPMRSHTSQGFNNDSFGGGYGHFDGIEIGASGRRNDAQVSNFVDRMEASLRSDQGSSGYMNSQDDSYAAPIAQPRPRPQQQQPKPRPQSVIMTRPGSSTASDTSAKRRSVWDVDRKVNLSRQSTLGSNASSAVFSATSNSTAATSASIMSGMSAGGFSATSAGSFARHKQRALAAMEQSGPHPLSQLAQPGPFSAFSPVESQMVTNNGVVFHSGRVSPEKLPRAQNWSNAVNTGNGLGGLSSISTSPKKKGGFFKKILASAKASTATARSMAAIPSPESEQAYGGVRAVGIVGGNIPIAPQSQDWVQVRRDVARSNTISRNERLERQEKLEMMDQITIRPIEFLEEECEGDEALDGGVVEQPADFSKVNMNQVDKAARFIGNLPTGTTPAILANGHICRPHSSDVQKLRAMFTWMAEKLAWERPVGLGMDSPSDAIDYDKDCRRVIQNLKATTEEVAVMFMQMCHSVGIGCEIIRGYLKVPGEAAETADAVPRPNHFWNAVVIDNEWRIIDASLASPTHPKRGLYSSAPNNMADSHYFLMRPLHACFTHIPLIPQQQHLVPPQPHAVLMSLPCASAGFFKNGIHMINFDTSLLRVEDLEIVQIDFQVPIDVECLAEVEANAFAVDADGDIFESGDIVKKNALAQVAWEGPLGNIQKTYRVKAVLPGDEGHGILKIYAGPRGLMHSIKDNPHPLAFSLPIFHTGSNPTYNFVTRHPTPHAQRHDLYIVQPQNLRIAFDNTYVFAIRQHASTVLTNTELAMAKGAKLAIQTPSGKIMKIGRRADSLGSEHGQIFEQSIKVSERGPWRGLVLADRSARWCVFAEWHCV
ncbi:cytokinesis protein 3 [Orbilia brochopaga]|uniref:Cytokinesis protein 3 n=1 Tax=Orbilia brochopaga TaxID=3140254 RepID=A0AAV9UUF6_9PEZI